MNKSWDDSSKQIQAKPSAEMKNTKSQSHSRSIHKYPELVKRFRLHTENTTYEGETFIEKWRKNEIPTKYESLIPIIISEQIRYFIPSYSKQVKHMEIQEINAYIHLYKSVAYMVKMKSTKK